MLKKTTAVLLLLLIAGMCSASMLTERWSYKTGAFRDILFDDLDNDASQEIVVLTGDRIIVLNSQGELLWKHEQSDVLSLAVSDLYMDNEKEIVFGTGNLIAGIARSFMWILGSGGEVLSKYPNSKIGSTILFNAIATEDLDGNGYEEIVVGTSKGVYVFKDNYKEELWYNKDVMPSDTIREIFIEDIAGDAKKDIVAKSFSRVYAIDFEGNIMWNFTIVNGIDVFAVDDILGEGTKNVILVSDGELSVLDKTGNVTKRISVEKGVNSIFIDDIDNDGRKEFLLSGEKNISYFDNNELNWTYHFNESLKGVFFENIDPDEGKELLIFTGSEIRGFSENLTLKLTEKIPYTIKNVFLADLDDDNEKETMVNERDFLYFLETNKTFWKKKLADGFYAKANEEFNLTEYENAENELQSAKEIYGEINDDDGLEKCALLSGEIEKMKDIARREDANNYYTNAVSFYKAEEYANATSNLNLARFLFVELNDLEGIEKCNSLLDEIERLIAETTTTITTEIATTTTIIEEKSSLFDDKLILVAVVLLLIVGIIFFFAKTKKRGKKNAQE